MQLHYFLKPPPPFELQERKQSVWQPPSRLTDEDDTTRGRGSAEVTQSSPQVLQAICFINLH